MPDKLLADYVPPSAHSTSPVRFAEAGDSRDLVESLEKWLNTPAETERLEFKEAKQQFTLREVEGFETNKLLNQQKSVLTQIELLLDMASASMSPHTSPYHHLKSCYRLNCKKRSPYSRRRRAELIDN